MSHLKHDYRKRGGINKRRINFFQISGNGGNETSKTAITRRLGLHYIDNLKCLDFNFFVANHFFKKLQ